MPPSPLLFDGLWQCLCPSLLSQSSSLPLRFATRLFAPRAVSKTSVRRTLSGTRDSVAGRTRQDATTGRQDGFVPISKYVDDPVRNVYITPKKVSKRQAIHDSESIAHLDREARELQCFENRNIMGTDELFDVLDEVIASGDSYDYAIQLIQYLVKNRHVTPDLRIFRRLILANTSPLGSAVFVREIWEEMIREGIRLDSGTLHALLKVSSHSGDFVHVLKLYNRHSPFILIIYSDVKY